MRRLALAILSLALVGADPNCSQQVGQRGMEEAADRIGQKIEVAANKFDPLIVELTRFVRVSANFIERSGSFPPAGLNPPLPTTGAGVPATAPAPTTDTDTWVTIAVGAILLGHRIYGQIRGTYAKPNLANGGKNATG